MSAAARTAGSARRRLAALPWAVALTLAAPLAALAQADAGAPAPANSAAATTQASAAAAASPASPASPPSAAAPAAPATPATAATAAATPLPAVLRVCQDPNNLPFSNRALQGFENKIAALLAADLGWKIEYTWYPQQMGFIRNTLRAKIPDTDSYKCDLVTGVAAGFDLGATTRPYYRSSYAMAYIKGKGFDSVHTLEDLLALPAERRASMRLGVFGGSPVADWLLENGLIDRMVSYRPQSGDVDHYPGEMVEKDLPKGDIDIAFLWGPIAGYYASRAAGGAAPVVAIPLRPHPGMAFEYDIVMATRFGENDYKQRIDAAIGRNRAKIDAILSEYGVPLLPPQARAAAH